MEYNELTKEQLINLVHELKAENDKLNRFVSSAEQQPSYLPKHEEIILKLLNNVKLGMVIIDQNHKVVEANQRFADMLGYSIDEMLCLHTWDWEAVSQKTEIEAEYADLSNTQINIETKHRRKDGTLIDVEVNGVGTRVGNSSGDNAILCFVRDISVRRKAEKMLMESEMKLRTFIENAPDIIFTLNTKGKCVYISPNCERILGFSAEGLIGDGIFNIINDTDKDAYLADLEAAFSGSPNAVCEYRLRLKDKHEEWFNVKFSPPSMIDGEDIVICNLRNINNRKINQERLEYLSTHDQLTGIHNRTYFDAVIQGKEAVLEPPISVIVLDFDELKKVNDNYGHAMGDEVLKTCTQIIKSTLRKNDVFARVGGDEFNILLSGASEEIAEIVMNRINKKIDSFNLLKKLPQISISAGISICKELTNRDIVIVNNPSLHLENAIKEADERMYMQKKEKKLKRKS